MNKRGVKSAIEYLRLYYPWAGVPEEIKSRAGLDIMASTLGRKLRDHVHMGDILVSYDEKGVARYQYKAAIVPGLFSGEDL